MCVPRAGALDACTEVALFLISLLCRRLGLPKGPSLHTLRHTHGSFLLADGVDLATVSERLGHSSVRVMADIYSHVLRGRVVRLSGRRLGLPHF